VVAYCAQVHHWHAIVVSATRSAHVCFSHSVCVAMAVQRRVESPRMNGGSESLPVVGLDTVRIVKSRRAAEPPGSSPVGFRI
jgi:hypothetical protein